MALSNIALYIIRSSIIFAVDIIMVLLIQNTVFRRYRYASRTLWIASMIHALLPFGILNIPINQDAARNIREYIREFVVINAIMFSVIAIIFTYVIINELRAYKIISAIFYVSHYDRNLAVYTTYKGGSAFAWGIINHRIVIPDDDIERGAFILRHERQHAAGNDNLLKAVYMFIMGSCWFQPVIFLSKSSFEDMLEICCDERVISGCDRHEVASYARCMYNRAVENDDIFGDSSVMCSNFARRRSQLYKRIKVLIDRDKRTFAGEIACRFVTVILVMVIMSVGIWNVEQRKYVETVNEWVEGETVEYQHGTECLNSDAVHIRFKVDLSSSNVQQFYNNDSCAVSYNYIIWED